MEQLLQDGLKRLYLDNSQRKPLVRPSITAKDILEEFQYDQDLVPQDIRALLRLSRPSNTISPIEANRAHAILWNPRIGVWLSDHAPYLYLLNGGSQEATDATTSFVMAKIAGTLLEQQQHHHHNHQQSGNDSSGMKHRNYYRDAAASPSELAMSLLLQLIDGYPNFSSATLQDCLDRTDPHRIASICDSLRRLLEELSPDVLVCVVVDGIAHFAIPQQRKDEMRELVQRLVEAFHGKIRATAKFIFSSPTRSGFLEDLFDEDEILNIPRDPPPANGSLARSIRPTNW
ncbi:hypothetical protein PG984_003913 [Apiospora sp. TS-2023a]